MPTHTHARTKQAIGTRETEVLRRLREHTHELTGKLAVMQVTPEQGQVGTVARTLKGVLLTHCPHTDPVHANSCANHGRPQGHRGWGFHRLQLIM